MEWVLILSMWIGGAPDGLQVKAVPMETKAACEFAGRTLEQEYGGGTFRMGAIYKCVPAVEQRP